MPTISNWRESRPLSLRVFRKYLRANLDAAVTTVEAAQKIAIKCGVTRAILNKEPRQNNTTLPLEVAISTSTISLLILGRAFGLVKAPEDKETVPQEQEERKTDKIDHLDPHGEAIGEGKVTDIAVLP